MDIGTLVSLVVLVTTITGSHALLRREFKAEIKSEIVRLEAKLDRIDDRLYQLATGLKPLVEQAEKLQAN
jgi:hypothetical protein